MFINLTPFIPLSFKGEGEEILERGETPLLHTLPLPLVREGGQGDGITVCKTKVGSLKNQGFFRVLRGIGC